MIRAAPPTTADRLAAAYIRMCACAALCSRPKTATKARWADLDSAASDLAEALGRHCETDDIT